MAVTKAEVLQAEFARLRKKYGKLTRDIIVREARSKRSVLHKEFIWDDKRAAHKQRLDRAQELLTTYITIRVTERHTTFRHPMYVRDPSLPPNIGGYISTTDKLDRSAALKIIDSELDRIESAVERGRAVSGSLDLQNPGVSAHFENMLKTVASARLLLQAAE